jgi:hypothetical protein
MSANILICSQCGEILGRKDSGEFDIYDCGWTCPKCKAYWHNVDGWVEVGNLLVPYVHNNDIQFIMAPMGD